MSENIISIDAETNGLWGQPFAVALVKYNAEGDEIDRATFRCPIDGVINPWVEENVIPSIDGITKTNESYDSMMQAIGSWWLKNKEGSTALWHMGHIVESHLFRELHRVDAIGDWDAPYTPIELSEILRVKGYAPDSVDNYIRDNKIVIPNISGGTHNPLYDAIVAAKVYFDLKSK